MTNVCVHTHTHTRAGDARGAFGPPSRNHSAGRGRIAKSSITITVLYTGLETQAFLVVGEVSLSVSAFREFTACLLGSLRSRSRNASERDKDIRQ